MKREAEEDLHLEAATEKDCSDKYDVNHFKVDPDTPTKHFSLLSIMRWSTVSKAEVRSNKGQQNKAFSCITLHQNVTGDSEKSCFLCSMKARFKFMKNAVFVQDSMKLFSHNLCYNFGKKQ